jgi:TrmH family RNA methyltransferase
VADPGNVGTLIRTADALGSGFVALSAGCADPTSPKALRASAGAVFRVPTASFDEAPRPWLALVASGGTPLWEADVGEGTFVLGAEREGVPEDVLVRCDERISIPQEPAAESLNVAVAGALGLYERLRRRPV